LPTPNNNTAKVNNMTYSPLLFGSSWCCTEACLKTRRRTCTVWMDSDQWW